MAAMFLCWTSSSPTPLRRHRDVRVRAHFHSLWRRCHGRPQWWHMVTSCSRQPNLTMTVNTNNIECNYRDDHLIDADSWWSLIGYMVHVHIYIYCVFVWVIVVSNNYWPSWSIMHNHRQSASVLINHHQLGPSKILGFPLWKPPYVSSSLASSMSHKTLDVAPLPLLPDQDDPTGDVPIASGWSKVHTPGCSHSHSS
jgi:hypothetical protein